MSKKALTETDICDQYITPAVQGAGWDQRTQIRREYTFTAGKVHVRGRSSKRGKKLRADYLLFFKPNLPLAVVEAKDNKHGIGHGLDQALAYARHLDVPFAFSSNGDGFVFHDRTGLSTPVERTLKLGEFPSPDQLWSRYRAWKALTDERAQLAETPYHDDGSGKEPRYYQRIAIQRVIEAVARGERRILVTMATGTGKTYTAFQIIWRLWRTRRVKRVLFLVDRNVLADQTMNEDFMPFKGVMTKVKNRTIDKSYEIYLALYQAVTGTDEEKDIYKEFSRDFFDLVVVDECHRGSAREESAWREVLEYFDSAVQLGMTATPKETKEVSTLTYFGDPVYTYSLKQGIEDGFLAPFKVVRIHLDRDLDGWRPPPGMTDDFQQLIEDRTYNQADMDRILVLNERTKRVAERIVRYMRKTDPYGKAIVFCEDIDHADRMRQAIANVVAQLYPSERDNTDRFVKRITGDSFDGKASLADFMHPERRYPVVATTSKLLSTGVNVKTCKLIVLDQTINSMIEFKQMVGRGTRIHEDAGKTWFTIMDFKQATKLFADPDWDGEPEIIYDPKPDDPDDTDPPDDDDDDEEDTDEQPPEGRVKYIVSGVEVSVVAERVQYYGPNGLVTESLRDYTRSKVRQRYDSLDTFLRGWSEAERKQAIIKELEEQGVIFEALRDKAGQDLDAFDLICHVVFEQPPLTRRERAENVKKRDVFTRYGEQARAVLAALLDKYADEGVEAIEDRKVLRLDPFRQMGQPLELVDAFGGRDGYDRAIRELEQALYARDAG